jgi:histidyl-tRNA synthetase
VSGGGRYDNLTQAFGSKERLSGVGISFGIDRIYDALEELQLFPREAQIASKVLVCHLDSNCLRHALGVVNMLRQNGIAAEVYPEEAKLKKQLEYANKKLVPYTIVLGSEEIASGQLALKNMQTGEQSNKAIQEIIELLK